MHFDPAAKQLMLSPILQWYAEDFGGQSGVIDFLDARAKSPDTLAGIRAARDGSAEIVYNDYDWSLNTQGKTAVAKNHAGFGSGSIPNE